MLNAQFKSASKVLPPLRHQSIQPFQCHEHAACTSRPMPEFAPVTTCTRPRKFMDWRSWPLQSCRQRGGCFQMESWEDLLCYICLIAGWSWMEWKYVVCRLHWQIWILHVTAIYIYTYIYICTQTGTYCNHSWYYIYRTAIYDNVDPASKEMPEGPGVCPR